jgi:hypothetical protein
VLVVIKYKNIYIMFFKVTVSLVEDKVLWSQQNYLGVQIPSLGV